MDFYLSEIENPKLGRVGTTTFSVNVRFAPFASIIYAAMRIPLMGWLAHAPAAPAKRSYISCAQVAGDRYANFNRI